MPFFLALTVLGVLGFAGVLDAPFLPHGVYVALALQAGISNLAYVAVHVIGAQRAGLRRPGVYAAILPFYYHLVSIATWRGFLQLMGRASYWEKTPHGLAPAPPADVLLRR